MDVILCAFSCSGSAPCQEWADHLLTNPAKVLMVPGANSTGFQNSGAVIAGMGLDGWIRRNHGPDKIDRIAVVTFSAGWGLLDTLLPSSQAQLIDSILVLDGIHTKALDSYVRFAKRAAEGGPLNPMMAMLHSSIVPPFVSSTDTNTAIIHGGILGLSLSTPTMPHGDPVYLTHYNLPTPVQCGNQYGRRTFTTDPFKDWEACGNLYRFHYSGNDAPTHIYIAQHVQPRAWQLLADRWNRGDGVANCGPVAGSSVGGGAVT